MEQSNLEERLNTKQPSKVFQVETFFLDLDVQNNQISKVWFYKKDRGTNTIVQQKYEDIKELLDPFPFQLYGFYL